MTQIRYMADSIDCTQIPASVAVPGAGVQPVSLRVGYAPSSRYHDSSTRCGQTDVLVDVSGAYPSADVLDIETGDATPAQAPAWVRAHNAARAGYPAILYCNRSTITAVANACTAAGLNVGVDYRWWISTLDGTQRVADMTGVTAVQVWGAGAFPGHNIDLSIVYDDAWKAPVVSPAKPAPPHPAPGPAPAPLPLLGEDMRLIAADQRGIALIGPGFYLSLTAAQSVSLGKVLGAPTSVPTADFDVIRAAVTSASAELAPKPGA